MVFEVLPLYELRREAINFNVTFLQAQSLGSPHPEIKLKEQAEASLLSSNPKWLSSLNNAGIYWVLCRLIVSHLSWLRTQGR